MIESTHDMQSMMNWTHTKNSCFIAIVWLAVFRTRGYQREGANVPPGEFASQLAASITAAKNSTSVIDGAGYFCWGREKLLKAWPRDASQSLTAGWFLSPFCRLMFNPFRHIWNTNTLKLIGVLRKTDGKSCFHPSVKVHIFATDAFELKLELGVITDENQLAFLKNEWWKFSTFAKRKMWLLYKFWAFSILCDL